MRQAQRRKARSRLSAARLALLQAAPGRRALAEQRDGGRHQYDDQDDETHAKLSRYHLNEVAKYITNPKDFAPIVALTAGTVDAIRSYSCAADWLIRQKVVSAPAQTKVPT
jgi:hypothetical protein